MDSQDSISNDLAPHGAVLQLQWEIHQRLPDGRYSGDTQERGRVVFDIKGDTYAITLEYLNTLIDLIKKKANNVSELEINQERLEQSRLQGTGQSRKPHSPMLGMRGSTGGNNPGGP